MKVYEAIGQAVSDEGCNVVFGLMGTGNMYLWTALSRIKNLAIYSVRHESGAVGAADGYSRVTGNVGIATVTYGPGLTQTTTALTVAARNRSSVILMVGEKSRKTKSRFQHIDAQKFADLCEARFQAVTHEDSWADEIAEAFYTAR